MAALNQPGEKILIDLINEANNTELVVGNLIFDLPVPLEADVRNTSIGAQPAPDVPTLQHFITFKYNRLDLAILFQGLSMQYTDNDATPYDNALDLLPVINAQYGLAMSEDDIESAVILPEAYPRTVSLIAKPTSLIYTGSVDVTINAPGG